MALRATLYCLYPGQMQPEMHYAPEGVGLEYRIVGLTSEFLGARLGHAAI